MTSSLLDQYKNQWEWRNWDDLFSMLPQLKDSLVYDLGCAHGDHTEKLSYLGANVHGIDANLELLNYAKNRDIKNSNFTLCNLRELDKLNLPKADGIWTSFVPAYFTDFENVLIKWKSLLKPNGWIAITEMSGLFDHLPMSDKNQKLLREFYNKTLDMKTYDFNSGVKIKDILLKNGFSINDQSLLSDSELSFQGPASKSVFNAWESRLNRMGD